MSEIFLPCTREVEIGGGVVYRPVRAWTTGCLAGERLLREPGRDGSGRAWQDPVTGLMVSHVPVVALARCYWRRGNYAGSVSALLSYPNGIGACASYFWEALFAEGATRFLEETEMEAAILDRLGSCQEHEDCRANRELGRACWETTRNILHQLD